MSHLVPVERRGRLFSNFGETGRAPVEIHMLDQIAQAMLLGETLSEFCFGEYMLSFRVHYLSLYCCFISHGLNRNVPEQRFRDSSVIGGEYAPLPRPVDQL